jgi:5-methylcytosine-specific restriction enzyme A
MGHFISTVTDQEIKKEKQKSRDLRKTQWWKMKCAAGKCYYCGREVPPQELTMDHIVPIIRGGKSAKNNLVPACKECNNNKKHFLPIEWEDYLKRLKKEKIGNGYL